MSKTSLPKAPRVSVMLPVYNSFSYARSNGRNLLAKALESFLSQSFTDFELLILDNQSEDDTAEVCRRFAQRDPRVRYIRDSQKRMPDEAINHLISEAKGEYCTCVGDDDIWHKDFLQHTVAALESDADLQMAYTDGGYIDIDGDPAGPLPTHAGTYSDNTNPLVNFVHYINSRNVVPICFGVYRTAAYRALLPFENFDRLNANVDNLFVSSFFLHDFRCRFIPEKLFFYRAKHRYADPDADPAQGMPPLDEPLNVWLYYVRHQTVFLRTIFDRIEQAAWTPSEQAYARAAAIRGWAFHCFNLLNWVATDIAKEDADKEFFAAALHRHTLLLQSLIGDEPGLWTHAGGPLPDTSAARHFQVARGKITALAQFVFALTERTKAVSTSLVEELQDQIIDMAQDFTKSQPTAAEKPLTKAKRVQKGPDILLVTLEFARWESARYWSYPISLGLEEALEHHGCNVITLPALYEIATNDTASWIHHARSIIGDRRFDQVWIEVVHSRLPLEFMEWLATLAPERVGFIVESLDIKPQEFAANREGSQRRIDNLEAKLPFLTAVTTADEKDADDLAARGIKTFWWPATVPEAYVKNVTTKPEANVGVFYGALYGPRADWLQRPDLKTILVRPDSPEGRTELPAKYDEFQQMAAKILRSGARPGLENLAEYCHAWRHLRRESFKVWLHGLQAGAAVVNLHHPTEIYSGRVVEAMAAGRPVVSFKITNRPRTERLFVPGNEILCFDREHPEELAAQLRRILADPALAARITQAAWQKITRLHTTEKRVEQFLKWQQSGALPEFAKLPPVEKQPNPTPPIPSGDFVYELCSRNLWSMGEPLRLHLGCGEQHLPGYVNVDYPPDAHNVMDIKADIHADILQLDLPAESVDEIRLHHVFEHFSRVTALAQLIRWQRALKPGGILHIETPDLAGSADTLHSDASFKVKMGVTRHLAGDQAASWAYHVDHWFPERYEKTLNALGFEQVQTSQTRWPHEPFLSNITAIATKSKSLSEEALLKAADELLWDSTVAAAERPTWEVWRRQLRECIHNGTTTGAANTTQEFDPSAATGVLNHLASAKPLGEILDFNQRDRDAWVREQAAQIPPGAKLLDVGAGTCPYRHLFAHCDYKTHDFKQYEGVKLGGGTDYGEIDYVSDIIKIPAPDNSFDVILCTEVLEHVPEPIAALKEMIRLVKPGGKLLITAPLGSGLHQLPFHFYGGYTPEWYRHFAEKFGAAIDSITPNGGFFKLLAQECSRVAGTLPQHAHLHGDRAPAIAQLFGEALPRFLFGIEEHFFFEQFTVGYHVAMTKTKVAGQSTATPQEQHGAPVILIFSKDRPLQLDATLHSLRLRCRDLDRAVVKVLYTTSNAGYRRQYDELRRAYPDVTFVAEQQFKADLLRETATSEQVLFLVDDNIFVRDFRLSDCVNALSRHPAALGVSLRLGRNTTYCYPLDTLQSVPEIDETENGLCTFAWPTAEHDFGYPLELSSSLYRTADILPLLEALDYANPNSLEGALSEHAHRFSSARSQLLCFAESTTFCAPLNKVQSVAANRAGTNTGHSPAALAEAFAKGRRIDVDRYHNFTPNGCHQEIELHLTAGNPTRSHKVQELIDGANESLAKNDMPGFTSRLQTAYEVAPDDNEIVSTWGSVLYQAGRHAEAAEVFRHLTELDTANPDAFTQLALAELKSDSIEAFEQALAHALDLDEHHYPSLKLLADLNFENGRWQDAVNVYLKIVDRDPGNIECLLALGVALAKADAPKDAERVFNMVLEKDPNNADAQANLAVVRGRTGESTPATVTPYPQRAAKPPMVSVVVPCFGQARFLSTAVASVINQTFTDWELIIVNDGSDDDTLAVARQLRDKHPGHAFTIITRPNAGLAEARNTGIRAARAPFILPLDADDALLPEYLARTVPLLRDDVDVVFTDLRCFEGSDELIRKGPFNEVLLGENRIPYCSLYRRTLWEQVGGYNPNMSLGFEDWDFWVGALEQQARTVHLDEPLLRYRVKTASMVTTAERRRNELHAQIILNHAGLYPTELLDTACTALEANPLPPAKSGPAPRFSIVVPCYNHAAYLPDAIESVVAQTVQDFEIIIVNDGSPDDTNGVADELIARHPQHRILLLEQPNGGLAAARNAGVRLASGEFYTPLDADDCLTPPFLEKLIPLLEADSQLGFAYPEIRHFGDADDVFQLPDYDAATLIHRDNIICGCALVRKSAWLKAGGYADAMRYGYEDWDFWISCAEAGIGGQCLHEPIFLYRKKSESMLKEANEKRPTLMSRIVLNHPDLYDAETRAKASSILRGGKQSAAETTDHSKPTAEKPLSGGKLRITFLISSIQGVTGGNQTLLRQADELHRRGHRVTIVTYTPKPAWFRSEVRVIVVPGEEPMAEYVPESDAVISTYFANTHELKSIKTPVKVYYAQGDQYVFADETMACNETNELLAQLSRLSYQQPEIRFIANSNNLANAVAKRYGRRADAVLPVCTDQEIFHPLPNRPKNVRPRILVVGPDARGSREEPLTFKGMGDIREALALLAQESVEVDVIRMSSTPPDIFADLRCDFVQAPDTRQKTEIYGHADILIYASHYDSCPRPPQEAMAAGVAVICTDTDGAREYCRDGKNALLIPIRSPRAIADAVKRLVQNEGLRQQLIAGGLKTAAEFPAEREWIELEELLLEYVAAARSQNDSQAAVSPAAAAATEKPKFRLIIPPVGDLGDLTAARALHADRKHTAAFGAVKGALAIRPFNPEGWVLLGEICRDAGDLAKARECQRIARSLTPKLRSVKNLAKSLRSRAVKSRTTLPALPEVRSTPSISVFVITKNEERFLGNCLKAVRDLADQLIVLDTGSTDRTIAIAKEYGAEIYERAWDQDFSAARNAALEHATGDWVLFLDADEELHPEQHGKLRADLEQSDVMAYRMPLVNAGQEEIGSCHVPRLWRNAPGLFFYGRIHEQIFPSILVKCEAWRMKTDFGSATIVHHGYSEELTRDRDKINRNLSLLRLALEELPDEPNLLMNFGLELVRAGRLEDGIEQYRRAFLELERTAASDIVPEQREALVTQYACHLHTAGRHAEVITLIDTPLARATGPTASLHFTKGAACFELSRYRDAVAEMDACLAKRSRPALTPINRDINGPAPQHCRALSFWKLEDHENARKAFAAALAADPISRPLRYDYARWLADEGAPVEALKRFHELVTEDALDLKVWLAGAQVAASRPQFLEFARDWIGEARIHHPQSEGISLLAAEIHLLSNDVSTAREILASSTGRPEPTRLALFAAAKLASGDHFALTNQELETEVSRQLLRFYRRLISFGVDELVHALNHRLEDIRTVLPTAGAVLSDAFDEAREVTTPARESER